MVGGGVGWGAQDREFAANHSAGPAYREGKNKCFAVYLTLWYIPTHGKN